MRLKKLLTLTAITILLAGCRNTPQATELSDYEVLEIIPSDITLESPYPAVINGRQDIDIYPKITGFIEKVNIREGERVRKGQLLFNIEEVQYRAALYTADANVEAAKAAVATAQLTFDSRRELFNRDVISQYELTTVENQLLTARAQLAQAEAQQMDARNNLSYTRVTSPADGIAGTLPYREGTLVNPSMSKPLTTVSDISSMYVYFSIAENQLLSLLRLYGTAERALAEMPDVILRLNDGAEYPYRGRIESISGVIDPSTGSISLRAVFPNPEALLRSGGSGNVIIPTVYRGVAVIPQSATVERQDKIYVFKVVDSVAKQSMIRVAKSNNGVDYIVESGLEFGDIIVSEGVGMLREGSQIRINNGEENK